MSENARHTAERVVTRLLDGDSAVQEYHSHEEFNQRAGGKDDPMRQGGGVTIRFPKGSFKGKRPGTKNVTVPPGKDLDPDDLKDKPTHPRWSWKPESQCGGAGCNPAKAWKQPKGEKGKPVAKGSKPVSYKEALMRRVIENIKVKKAMKMGKAAGGKAVSSGPGTIKYRSEAKMAIKGLGKKKPAAVASAPGKVGRGKR